MLLRALCHVLLKYFVFAAEAFYKVALVCLDSSGGREYEKIIAEGGFKLVDMTRSDLGKDPRELTVENFSQHSGQVEVLHGGRGDFALPSLRKRDIIFV